MPDKPKPKTSKAQPKSETKPKSRRGRPAPQNAALVAEIAARLRREVKDRLGPNSTFEERQNATYDIMKDVMWQESDDDLRESITNDDEIDVGGTRYRRMQQASSATYSGRWGPHDIEEALYREVGVHNGATIKPIELRVGIIEHMTPDMARVVGALSAGCGSRVLARTLCVVGLVPPSRAFLADRTTRMGAEIADGAADLETAAREVEEIPEGVASVSCGLDRMAVRMSELADLETASLQPSTRTEPYERTPPPPKVHPYRKAWVGSTSVYDADGKELRTWRIAVEADADRDQLADRVAADAAWILQAHPNVPVHCIQDAAPELRALPEALQRALPAEAVLVELVDFEHVMGYLDDVIDASEPDVAARADMKKWIRYDLLADDAAIDRIQRNLREKAKSLPRSEIDARKAVAAALSYIKKRKQKMRYASHYEANLPIGSGATESTCWQMQQRVKLVGQSWEIPGLRGVLAIRGLVLSDRWDTAWPSYAADHRMEVCCAA